MYVWFEMKLHVISFDIPWPANYGGVIDVYNRLDALHAHGVEVILHAFDYGRGPSPQLSKVCSKVHYYKRKNRAVGLLTKDPMIISTRSSEELLSRLDQDDYPILFEGQHTTALLDHPLLKERVKVVRLHNIEHEYYLALHKGSSNPGKSVYFKREAEKLKKHEEILKCADQLLCITKKDTSYYEDKFGNASYLPVAIQCMRAREENLTLNPYILYHGNLSVVENSNAAKWILENICPKVDHDFIFAGKEPNSQLKKTIAKLSNVSIIENPSEELMQKLVYNAVAHVFYTDQSTGIKIKLLNAMCSGAPIYCNSTMVEGTGLREACIVNNDSEQYASDINSYLKTGLKSEALNRKELLERFSYASHVKKLMSFLQ